LVLIVQHLDLKFQSKKINNYVYHLNNCLVSSLYHFWMDYL